MAVDAEYRPLVGLIGKAWRQEQARAGGVHSSTMRLEENAMGRGILLWMLGVPIPVIILLWLFFGH
ncbi:hypothetical protein AB7M17_006041 [Bradyrhizobium sp. USDA 377]